MLPVDLGCQIRWQICPDHHEAIVRMAGRSDRVDYCPVTGEPVPAQQLLYRECSNTATGLWALVLRGAGAGNLVAVLRACADCGTRLARTGGAVSYECHYAPDQRRGVV
jgi:hypothetical protein